ncbi:MAG: hypothetical protein K9H13_02070, partial [Bacteroidales bacterium]|nr:hypothetical protein [Bacteroidales bacterium]
MKIKHDELKKQFNILLDFFQNDSNRDYKLMSCYRSSFIPAPCPNFDRYNSKGYGSSTSVYFDSDIFRNTIISTLNTYVTFKKIYDIIIDINPTFLPKKDLKEDLNSKPSITTNIIAGFIAKVYDLKINNETAITDAFNHTFDSLIYFLKHDNVQINTLISLDGPSGILDEISLNESFKIKKANYNIVKEFSLLYNQVLSPIQNVIHENDYYLEINHVINKHDYQDYYNSQNKIIDKLFNIIAISDVGNIEKGKRIIKTDAWPLCLPKRGSAPIQTEDKYNIKNKFI